MTQLHSTVGNRRSSQVSSSLIVDSIDMVRTQVRTTYKQIQNKELPRFLRYKKRKKKTTRLLRLKSLNGQTDRQTFNNRGSRTLQGNKILIGDTTILAYIQLRNPPRAGVL